MRRRGKVRGPNCRPESGCGPGHLGRCCLALVWPTQLSTQEPAQEELLQLVRRSMLGVRVGRCHPTETRASDYEQQMALQTSLFSYRCLDFSGYLPT